MGFIRFPWETALQESVGRFHDQKFQMDAAILDRYSETSPLQPLSSLSIGSGPDYRVKSVLATFNVDRKKLVSPGGIPSD
jgi:hypothetical protein